MSSFDKDTRLLIIGVLLGAGMSALYDLFKTQLPTLLPNIPQTFTIVISFLASVGLISGIFALKDWKNRRGGKTIITK